MSILFGSLYVANRNLMERIKLSILFFRLSILIFISSGLFFYFPTLASPDLKTQSVAGEFLVKFKDDPKIYRFKSSVDLNINLVIQKYQGKTEVEYIEPNYILQAAAFPSDPDYSLQWYLTAINIKDVWSKELLIREQENINRRSIIAILDTGVDLSHPDLKDKIWVNQGEKANDSSDNDRNGYRDDINGWDFVDNDSDPSPSFDAGYNQDAVKHGTIVAGIAAASTNNQQGIAGLSWFSQIMSLRVLDSSGSGDVYSVVQAIDYAVANGADVINMSFVGTGFSQSLFNAIQRAYNQDVLVVAAAGNTDPKVNGVDLDFARSYPVCYDGISNENMVIGVASLGKDLKKSEFSNYGGCVDLVAPGESFYSTQPYRSNVSGFTKYYDGYWSGTSLSAPLVSGVLATIKSLRPNLSGDEIKNIVLKNTKDISAYNPDYLGKLGYGLLDPIQALESALAENPTKGETGENNYIVAALGVGSFPQIKVLKEDGEVFKAFYAYSPHFNGVINVATGDVNGDGKAEIITGAGAGGGPHVRIFNIEGQVLSQFFAYDKNSRNGVNIAVGDVNGDGKDEIITGSGKGGLPEVKIFDYEGILIGKLLAYDESFLGGVKVAVGDVNGDGKAEIITGAGAGGGPHVRIFDFNGQVISQFFAYNKNFKGGVNVACGDVASDNKAEVIASIEKDSVPTVRIFNYQGVTLSSFFAYEPNFLAGVYVATGDINGDGISEIITGKGFGGSPEIKAFDWQGKLKVDILAYQEGYRGGARPAVMKH